jgi:glycosyltransferase involved in cell wall biosynthesis
LTEPRNNREIVVGISGNVIDSGLSVDILDGISVYTRALERSLTAENVSVRRIGAPVATGLKWRHPTDAQIAFATPLASSIAWTTLTRRPAPFTSRVEDSIDVFHCTDYLVPKLHRTPIVATLYDAIPLLHPEWANPRLRAIKNRLIRTAAHSADIVIAISNASAAEIVEGYGISRERIRVIPLGVDEAWFDPLANTVRSLQTDPRIVDGYFLFVGTLQPRKDIATLLRAYESLPADVRAVRQLVIVGRYGWGAAELRDRLRAMRPGGRVLWLERVDDTLLRALYSRAAALVFPSLGEGFGLPLLEALAGGIPVVCSDLPVFKEVAGDCAAYVAPGDADGFARAMIAATRQSLSTASEGRRGRASMFSWRTTALATLDVYREAIAMRPR